MQYKVNISGQLMYVFILLNSANITFNVCVY